MKNAHERGYTATQPHYNSIFRYLENAALTPLLRDLIERSSLPLKAAEIDFAADSTGFTTSRFHRWFDVKYGVIRFEHDWVKAHVMTSVKTNIVTAVEILDRNASDTKQLPALLATTAKNFTVAGVSADKAYGSIKNINAISDLGAAPYIPFKSIHTGRGSHRKGAEDTGAWTKAFGYFMYRRDDFLAHYHKRSNVETTFSMHELGIDPHAFGWDTVAPALELPA